MDASQHRQVVLLGRANDTVIELLQFLPMVYGYYMQSVDDYPSCHLSNANTYTIHSWLLLQPETSLIVLIAS